jgi:predicted RNA-binding Zn ribbon-like protein
MVTFIIIVRPLPRSTPGAIPHTISTHVCVDFVNSRFTDHTGNGQVYDRLELEEWQWWFSERCGVDVERPPSPAMRRRLIGLRDLLRRLLESRRVPDDRALSELNLFLDAPSQSWELARVPHGVELRRVWRPWDWRTVMAITVASYGELVASGENQPVRVCANPDCTFMFVDESRNQSRRWCEPAACGNLVKVRRHRAQRQRDATTSRAAPVSA